MWDCRHQEVGTRSPHPLKGPRPDTTTSESLCEHLFGGKCSLWCASWKECILPFSSRCQDYTWSLNPQNRHCYKVCHLENFWSTQQITHLVGRATTHTATRQTITGFLLRWHESFARFRYFLVYHSLARPNPSHPWHWDSLPIVRMFPQKSTGGDLVSLGDSGEADFVRFPFDVWPISDFYLMFGKRGCTPSNIFEDCCVFC